MTDASVREFPVRAIDGVLLLGNAQNAEEISYGGERGTTASRDQSKRAHGADQQRHRGHAHRETAVGPFPESATLHPCRESADARSGQADGVFGELCEDARCE